MATNFVEHGDTADYTNATAAAIVSGQLVVFGKRAGIAIKDIPIGATESLTIEGVFNVPKDNTQAFAQGDLLYWNAATSKLTTTVATNVLVGYAHQSALLAATSACLKING
jgi:predicted RecA/RadA family phage recombinase